MTIKDIVDAAQGNPPRSAPYTFVDAGRIILPSPVADLDLSRPVAGAVSGTITVTWKTETPLLVGGGDALDLLTDDAKKQASLSPLEIGGQYALPGSTIKGLIRSVMESACFARLSFVDDHAAAVRSFTDSTWKKQVKLAQDDRPTGGWLFRTPEGYRLVPAARTMPLAFTNFLPLLKLSKGDWHKKTMDARLTAFEKAGKLGRQDWGAGAATERLVVSGKTAEGGELKNKEYLFLWPDDVAENDSGIVKIDRGTGDRFRASLHRDSHAEHERPAANFDALIHVGRTDGFLDKPPKPLAEQLENPDKYGLPVFWRNPEGGDRAICGDKPILSLTAFLRVPYQQTIKDLIAKTQGTLDPNQYDLVQALLGWAPPDAATKVLADRPKTERALRSRVRFGFALSDNAVPEVEPKIWAATQPKPSFWPYYLKANNPADAVHPVDFNNPDAILSGRKRYPARGGGTQLPAAEANSATNQNRDAMEQRLTFLKAGATFTSEIRVSNVTPVELGALIWAITFGDLTGDLGYRHMIGRAKSYGYGQVEAAVECNLKTIGGGAKVEPETAIQDYKNWASAEYGEAFDTIEPIRVLLGTAHAATGKALTTQLVFPRKNGKTGDSEGQKVLNAYGAIKDQAANPKEWSGKKVSETGSMGLPPYLRDQE